jgi:hypothetical protein
VCDNVQRKTFTIEARSWPERILLGIMAVAIVVLGFFFLTVALVAGAIVAAVVLARIWWLARKVRAAQRDEAIDGEYVVVERAVLEQRQPSHRDAPEQNK